MSRPSLRKERWPLFVMSAFLWIGLPVEAQQNGIYIQNMDGPLMTTQDGKQAHLGDRRTLQIRESVFMPRNNENSSFYLSIRVPEDPALRRALHVLVVNGVAYRQYGGGYGEGRIASPPDAGRDPSRIARVRRVRRPRRTATR